MARKSDTSSIGVSIIKDLDCVIIESLETLVITETRDIKYIYVTGDVVHICTESDTFQVCCKTYSNAKVAAIRLHKIRKNTDD